jgi:hypothetical protein
MLENLVFAPWMLVSQTTYAACLGDVCTPEPQGDGPASVLIQRFEDAVSCLTHKEALTPLATLILRNNEAFRELHHQGVVIPFLATFDPNIPFRLPTTILLCLLDDGTVMLQEPRTEGGQ